MPVVREARRGIVLGTMKSNLANMPGTSATQVRNAPCWQEKAERLGALRHARERMGVVPGLVRDDYYRKSPPNDPQGPDNRYGPRESWRLLRRATRRIAGRRHRGHESPGLSSSITLRLSCRLNSGGRGSTAAEPTTAPPKQITNSIGMKLTLVPSGEFMMGSKESAEETAAFFNKTYGERCF